MSDMTIERALPRNTAKQRIRDLTIGFKRNVYLHVSQRDTANRRVSGCVKVTTAACLAFLDDAYREDANVDVSYSKTCVFVGDPHH